MTDRMQKTIDLSDTAKVYIYAAFDKLAPRTAWWPHVTSKGEMQGLNWTWNLVDGLPSYGVSVLGDDERLKRREEEFLQALILAVDNAARKVEAGHSTRQSVASMADRVVIRDAEFTKVDRDWRKRPSTPRESVSKGAQDARGYVSLVSSPALLPRVVEGEA